VEKLIKNIISEKQKIKFIKFYNKKNKLKIYENNLLNCPFPDCEELIINKLTYENKFFECRFNHKFCAVCKILYDNHDEKKCKNVFNKSEI
jgi:hypothetical protein